MKYDEFDGTVVNGVRQQILFTFVLEKPPEYKVFCEPGTVRYKITKKINCEYYNIIFRR